MRMLGPDWHCRKLLWYIRQGSAIYSWQKRNAQKHNQKWLKNPVSCEVRKNLFRVTSLHFVVHIHTLSCFLSSRQRSRCLAILIEQTLSVSTHTFYNGIKRTEYICHAWVSLQSWSYRYAKLKKTPKPNNPPQSPKTKQNKTKTERAGYGILCAIYLETLHLLQNNKLLFHSWMIYWMHILCMRIPKQ